MPLVNALVHSNQATVIRVKTPSSTMSVIPIVIGKPAAAGMVAAWVILRASVVTGIKVKFAVTVI